MTASDPAALALAVAARLIQKRELSPVDLTEGCLRRIDDLQPQINAFITVTAERAMGDASRAAQEISRRHYRGPLHGIPVALKDLFDTAGVRTTFGSKILAGRVPKDDGHAAETLQAAGAVLLGKLNLHEIALGATGVNPHYGACRNPWDTARITGGSSSGSGAAVASGMALAALGTDTGGSIRIPASLCGIVGLKPTFGRVSRRGVLPLSWSLDHAGPMTRTVEDAAILLGAIAGHDPTDPSSIDEPVPDYRAALRPDIRDLRIGIPSRFFFDSLDPEVESGVRTALKHLSGLGADLREIDLPHIDEAPGAVSALMLPEALAYHQKWLAERPDDYGDDVRLRLEGGASYLAVHYVQAQRFREMIVDAWRREVFGQVDIIATPTTIVPALPIDRGELQATLSLIRNTNPFNLLGVPAISVPCGFTQAGPSASLPDGPYGGTGLPIGLQLAGSWWDEATVLRAAYTYEQSTDWHKRLPVTPS